MNPCEGALGRPGWECVPSDAGWGVSGLVGDALGVDEGGWGLSGDALQNPQRTGAICERCTRTLMAVKPAPATSFSVRGCSHTYFASNQR